jgi:hypothetical protein
MKKIVIRIILAFLVLIVGTILYYLTNGSTQIAQEMKARVNTELQTLNTQGIAVQNREVKESEEHFVLSFDETQKAYNYLKNSGIVLGLEDAKALEGLKLGVDIKYLANTYSAISIDLYPLQLPTLAKAQLQKDDKLLLVHIEKMLKEKAILAHIDVNKLANGFKGSIKDINETFQDVQTTNILMQGTTFSGDIEDQEPTNIASTTQHMSVRIADAVYMGFRNLSGFYSKTGKSAYDYNSNYLIESFTMTGAKSLHIWAKECKMDSVSKVTNDLLSATFTLNANELSIKTDTEKIILTDVTHNFAAKNFSISAFDALQNLDFSNQKETDNVLSKFLVKGVNISIPQFSVGTIEYQDKKIAGFNLNAFINVDKKIDASSLTKNPMAALGSISTKLHVDFSPELFTIISQQPQAMIVLMLFQPKIVDNQKVYDLEVKNAEVTINGTPLF